MKKIPLIFLVFLNIYSFSQTNIYNFSSKKLLTQYIVENWGKDEGLPTLTDICQTDDGFIWVSSFNGLIQLYGTDFKLYNNYNTLIFKGNGIEGLEKDNKGNLWMTSQNEGLISFKEGIFTQHLIDSSFNQLYPFLFIDKFNRVWAASRYKGLFYYQNGDFTFINDTNFSSDFEIFAMEQDKNDAFWIGTSGYGLFKYDKGKFTQYTVNEGLSSNWVKFVFCDSSNTLWIGTDEGLCTLSNNKISAINKIPNTEINAIIQDKNHNIWIGTHDGLFLKQPNSSIYEHLSTKNGLYKDYISDIMLDNENTLWFINYRGGLSRLKDSKFDCYTNYDGLNGDIVNSIIEIEPNKVLLAYDNGNIDFIDNELNKILPFSDINLNGTRIRNLFKDSKNNLWISTYSGLLKISNDGTKKWYSTDDGLPEKYIRLVFEDSKNNIWIGTRNSGLVKMKPDQTFTIFDKSKGFFSKLIMSIDEDSIGNIIVGTNYGLYIITPANKVEKYLVKDGIIGDVIFNTFIDKNNRIWVATKGGLNLIFDNNIYSFPVNQNILKDSPYDIIEDNFGNFWMPCSNGIMKAPKQDFLNYIEGKTTKINTIFYNHYDGIKQPQNNPTASSIKSANGKLWFPTLDGVTVIDQANLKSNTYVPPVYIIKVNVDSSELDLSVKDLKIDASKKRVTIYFSALSYYEPINNQYQYTLKGFDNQWSKPSNENSVSYTNLPYGKYTFRVRGSNNDDVWNKEYAQITFFIKPHFYQTKIFYTLFILTILILIYSAYKIRVRRLRNKQITLEAIISKRTSEIHEKNEELIQQNEEIKNQAEELQKLSIIAKETDNVILFFDDKFNLKWTNKAYNQRYDEFFENSIIGKNLTEISSNSNIKNIINQCITTKKTVIYESHRKTKNNDIIWLQSTLTPLFENNTLKNFVLIDANISEIKNATIEITKQKQHITSSIEYAKSIQEAIFPVIENIKKFVDIFILFKPKDIVSGDYYWFNQQIDFKTINKNYNNKNCNTDKSFMFGLIDSTGHGVPGAFLSVLGYTLLNDIVNERKIIRPKDVLDILNNNVRELLKQEKNDNVEGMDVALCLFRIKKDDTVIINYSGAKISIYYKKTTDKNVQIIKADRKSIGGVFFKHKDQDLTEHEIHLKKGDTIYLSSDGYIDQCNIQGRRFGSKRLLELFNNIVEKELLEQKTEIEREITNWQQSEIQRDDITVIGIKI